MTNDPHAENRKLYEQDALETDKPWERWEFCIIPPHGLWYDCYDQHMSWWGTEYQYRRKTTLTINGHEVPMPLYARPDGVDRVFVIAPSHPDGYAVLTVVHIPECNWQLGIHHLTAEAAVLHTKAILSFTERKKP
jgi:hypothetical protein